MNQPRGGGQQRPARGTQPQLRPARIEEIVETDVVTASRDDPITTVVEDMASEDVGSVVVVEDDRPVGIVTDRSIALCLRDQPDASERTVGEILSEDLVTGTTDMNVFEVLRQLEDAEVRRLPIVDEDGTLAGIVTLDDILFLLGAELGNATAIIEAQSPRI